MDMHIYVYVEVYSHNDICIYIYFNIYLERLAAVQVCVARVSPAMCACTCVA